tara:strand:- start:572 stop:1036 length:465 start_codon:yes stop_codon:yes gene_type:complete
VTEWESIERFAVKLAVHQASFNELLGLSAFEELRQEWRYYYTSLGYSLPEVLALELHIAECHDRLVSIKSTLERQERERNAQELITQGSAKLVAAAAKSGDGNFAMIYSTPSQGQDLYEVIEDSKGKLLSCQQISNQALQRRLRSGTFKRPTTF